jgi:hypothetical protein
MNALDSRADIARAADGLLRRASVVGRLPTPVDDLVAAACLTEPDESMLSPTVLRLAPAHLQQAIGRIAGRVRGLIDRRALEVHIDPDVTHEGRRNFIRLHETGHHILDWQRELAYADSDASLSPATRELFELEASQCGADLLFQGHRFEQDVADVAIGLPAVIMTAQRYGSSIRAALRRYAETHRAVMISVVLDMSPESLQPLRFRRHEIAASATYVQQFGEPVWPGRLSAERHAFLSVAAAASASPNDVTSGTWAWADQVGSQVEFNVDALSTGHDLLILAWVPIRERTRRRVRFVPAKDWAVETARGVEPVTTPPGTKVDGLNQSGVRLRA